MADPIAVLLHIDDNEAHRYTVTRRLRRAGFEVKEASTGASGMELARTKPDLIVLDIKLPDMSGFDVCARLKQDPHTSSIPILHLSAHRVGSKDVVHGLDLGADGYLTEPIEIEELVATIKALLRVRASEDRAKVLAAKWQATFDAIQDPICLIEPDGIITHCNAAMCRLMNLSIADLVGNGYFEILERGLGEIKNKPKGSFHYLDQRKTTEVQIGDRYYHLASDPMFDSAGAVSGAVIILKDITETRVSALSLERYASELKRSNSELEHFAHIASHDLKEPLRAVSNYVALLDRQYRPVLDAHAQEYMDFITNGAQRMHALINDLLIFSRVGNEDLKLAPVDCNLIFDKVVSDLAETIRACGGRCTRTELPTVCFDPHQMTQVFQNLITNALKFHSNEAPCVEVFSRQEEGRCVISVRDNGIGISSENRDKVFVLFKRLHSREQYPGTGIGLAICKKIVERYGGSIWFDSKVGEGTTFSFTLPTTTDTELEHRSAS